MNQSFLGRTYYKVKFLLPRPLRLAIRRDRVRRLVSRWAAYWPIDPRSSSRPKDWAGWPEGKRFALVLTHDVESTRGLERCLELAAIEERYGFRSSFNFVAGDYVVPEEVRRGLVARGFEVGIHGLHHKGNAFSSERKFRAQARLINRYLDEWDSVGFRAPSMFHDLDLAHHLDIEYDASTFDTDPFEPQPDGMATIFPFWVPGRDGRSGYVELPYTLPQDHLLFILMRERSGDIWKKKLDWIAQRGGMGLVITHPDYMSFRGPGRRDEYPVRYYEEFLSSIKESFSGQYWHALPRDVARLWKSRYSTDEGTRRKSLRVCMVVYNNYEYDNRVMRYAEALAGRGDHVDILAVGLKNVARFEKIRGVDLYRIQNRESKEKNKYSYIANIAAFFFKSLFHITRKHLRAPYDLVHIHSVPDFLAFVAAIPKLSGAKVVLDIHDIVPEFYANKYSDDRQGLVFRALVRLERLSCRYADHVVISNHLWFENLTSRSVSSEACSVILNYPDDALFFRRPARAVDDKCILMYPGTLAYHQGLDIAIKAFALIKDLAPEAEFHIYGGGPVKDDLRRLVGELGVADRVFIKGGMPIAQIAEVMAGADIGVVPKRNDRFGGSAFSTKILEFMSLGVPVIAAATKIDSYYFDGSVLKFFHPGDADDLARRMLEMIKDKAERARLARNAQAFVADYRWDIKKSGYFELVDRLVSSRGRRERRQGA